jgi:aldose 1-epimerase
MGQDCRERELSMTVRSFGETPAGEAVQAVRIAGGGLVAEVLTWGAVVRTLHMSGHEPPLVLGFERLEDYLAHSPYFGAIVGRFANRIAHGRFTLDGHEYQLDCNERGQTHLHGGSQGFGVRAWELVEAGSDYLSLRIVSEDGDMGYPGRCMATCTYRLIEPGTLRIELGAASEAATIVNLAHHGYFNLDGLPDLSRHTLTVAAQQVTAVDADLIPTGAMLDVTRTIYDLRQPQPLMPTGVSAPNYDVNFCLDPQVAMLGGAAARLASAASGVALEVWTTEPGLQVYGGHLIDVPVAGLDGRRYGPRAGICLEAQRWPDAPNHPAFPSAVLRPGSPYAQITEYRFSSGN